MFLSVSQAICCVWEASLNECEVLWSYIVSDDWAGGGVGMFFDGEKGETGETIKLININYFHSYAMEQRNEKEKSPKNFNFMRTEKNSPIIMPRAIYIKWNEKSSKHQQTFISLPTSEIASSVIFELPKLCFAYLSLWTSIRRFNCTFSKLMNTNERHSRES